ncbi:MAG: LD-carboxypeptidase [Flavobacteriales bacterium]|nr:LD-carboxypeptidase [Flavobacteriales bacterium]
MEKPQPLSKGDKIALISTARKITLQEIEPAISILKLWGLEPVFGKNLFKINHQFAGTTEDRIADLQETLDNPEIKAILCVRGGYGTVQLIDGIDFSTFKKQPKWIIGYSDITVLHNHINKNFGVSTLHATMPINFTTNTKEALESLKETLFGALPIYTTENHQLNRLGEATGELVGGNLSIIYSLTGTPSQLDTKGKILFLEDLDEYLYHIDRMMMNLKRVGMLTNLKGLIVGGMSDMKDNTVPFGKSALEIIFDAVKEYHYPVCFDFPAGHVNDNRSLIMGSEVNLVVDKDWTTLEFI